MSYFSSWLIKMKMSETQWPAKSPPPTQELCCIVMMVLECELHHKPTTEWTKKWMQFTIFNPLGIKQDVDHLFQPQRRFFQTKTYQSKFWHVKKSRYCSFFNLFMLYPALSCSCFSVTYSTVEKEVSNDTTKNFLFYVHTSILITLQQNTLQTQQPLNFVWNVEMKT